MNNKVEYQINYDLYFRISLSKLILFMYYSFTLIQKPKVKWKKIKIKF